jgi:hypothetical protein
LDHWKAAGTALGLLSGWLGRRRAAHWWRSLTEVLEANRRLENCRIERDDAIRSRDYLRMALKEITEAAATVKAAHDAGYLTISAPSESGPTKSPTPSGESSPKPKGPLDLPSR